MKILFVSNIFAPHVRGGYELGCLELAEKYNSLDYQVIIATSENTPNLCKYPDPNHLDVRRIFMPVKYYDEAYNFHFQTNAIYFYEKIMAFGGYIEPNCIALKRLIEQENPDLVWIFNSLGLGPIGILDTVLSGKTKVLVHLMEHIDGVILDYNKIFNLISKWKYLKSQVVAISCSEKIIKSNSLLGKYKNNSLVYNWVDLSKHKFPMPEAKNQFDLEKSQLQADLFKIVYFGQVAEKKGITFLLDVAEKISKSRYKDKIVIDIYGKGEENFTKFLQKRIENTPYLSKTFVIKGFLSKDKLLDKLVEYDLSIFLLSDDEPFAYAPIEAILNNLPVIITSESGNGEIFKDGYDVIFVEDRKNINQVYKKIVWCFKNQDKLEKIKSNAQDTIKKYSDLDAVTIPQLNRIIESLSINPGYPFQCVLNTCEMLKYPYFELGINQHLSGARYKFIDKLVNYIYGFPVIGQKIQPIIKSLVRFYKRKNT